MASEQGTLDRARRARAAFVTLAVAAPLAAAGPAIAGYDKGKGDERPETAPGQIKSDGERAQPAHPNSKAKGHGKTTRASKGKSLNKGHKYGHNKSAKPSKQGTKGTKGKSAHPSGKTTICHATGSDTNPYVKITVSNNALKAHDRHQNDEDIIPAPAGDCPTTAPAPAAASAAAGKTEAISAPAAAAGGVLGETASGTITPSGAVLGDTAEGTTRRESGAEGAVASGTLPFTGADIWLLVIVGLGALLAGVALHRSLGNRGTV